MRATRWAARSTGSGPRRERRAGPAWDESCRSDCGGWRGTRGSGTSQARRCGRRSPSLVLLRGLTRITKLVGLTGLVGLTRLVGLTLVGVERLGRASSAGVLGGAGVGCRLGWARGGGGGGG